MSKVWFCRQCGYEVPGRGRCHVCKQRLQESPLPELEAGAEEDEVGYRLEDWADHTRGALIVALIEANVLHRFEEDELVVGAEDEERVDDLVERVATEAVIEEEERIAELPPDELSGDVEMLLGASRRLVVDPTDMQADADTLESSSAVFMAEDWFRTDPDTWAAVGRVTRRLLAALGADEALEDEIKLQAAILVKLLGPSFEPAGYGSNGSGHEATDEDESGSGDEEAAAGEPAEDGDLAAAAAKLVEANAEANAETDDDTEDEDEADEESDGETDEEAEAEAEAPARSGRRFGLRRRRGREEAATESEEDVDDEDESGDEDAASDSEGADSADTDSEGTDSEDAESDDADSDEDGGPDDDREGESVYELPDWLPEQRAHLSIMMDDAGITYLWESGDLIVPLARDTDVEALFGQVQGVEIEEDDEARYRALEALFAASDRFLNDPDSETKAAEVVRAVEAADGPTPVGVDDALWWTIRQQAKGLAAAIEADASLEQIYSDTKDLRDALRPLM